MKTSICTKTAAALLCTIPAIAAFSQQSPMDEGHMHGPTGIGFWFGFMELPFLFICVIFAFMTASALKGGKFGKGMKLMAWGFVVMAVGHLHMQVDHFYHFNLFNLLFGEMGGSLAWFLALVVTWLLSAAGFYSMYKAGKGR
jgi:hypothetical protein